MKRMLACLLVTAMIFGLLPAGHIYAETEETENIHYLGFASDLHAVPDVLEDALGQFPAEPEYFSLIGDMVGGFGNMKPEFRTSETQNRVTNVFPNLCPENGNLSIIWAAHDENADDDTGIVKCMGDPKGYTSGQIYEGKNNDGTTAYYIYGIGFYHMNDGGPESKEAAEAFKEWVKDKDVSVPVLVLCHMPLKAARGDNKGAYYWNEALNYAATGVEGIMTEDAEEAEIIRNVIYLYGHNHTVDRKEYVHKAGTAMSVQIDPNLVMGAGGKIIETEAYDEEIAAEEAAQDYDEDDPVLQERPPRPNVRAQGIISKIYYTSVVAGYLKTSGNATLMTITDTEITLRKYNGQGETDMGSDDAGETVGGPLVIRRISWNEPEYTWSDDLSEVTAVRTQKDSSYAETETVQTTSEITKEPTCMEEGERTYTAVFENKAFEKQTKVQTVDKADHTPGSPKTENNVRPKCDMDGSYDEVFYCAVCGQEISRKTIPVGGLGHDWGEWKVTKEPTADTEGSRTRTCRRDPSHTETESIPASGKASLYKFTKGAGSTYTAGSSYGLSFTVKREKEDEKTYSLFTQIEIDGKKIDEKYYTVSKGSLKITLKASCLQGLSAGKHTIKAVFEDGSAETTFTVKSKKTGSKSPNTYDDSDLLLWFTALLGSLIVSAGCAVYRRKHSAG